MDDDTRWVVRHGQYGVDIEPAINSCREYDCCLGKTCGWSLGEVQAEVVAYYQRQADHWRGMTPQEFMVAQGYKP